MRCCAKAPNPHCHGRSSITSQKSGMGWANQRGPTGPREHIDPCGYSGPDGGGRGRTLAPAARYLTTSRCCRGSGWRRPASSVLDEVEDAGPPMPTGPMLHAEGRCAIGTVRWGGAGACAHVHRPQCPIGWKCATLPVQWSNTEAFVSRNYCLHVPGSVPNVPGSVPNVPGSVPASRDPSQDQYV